MNLDPNELTVIDDTEKQSTANEGSKETPPIDDSENQPIIPTVAELNAPKPVHSGQFNDAIPPNQGVDAEAPYGRNKDGTPAKKRGRKGSSNGDQFDRLDSVTVSTPSRTPQARGLPSPAIVTDYRPIASLATGLWIGIPQLIFGEDWKASESDEKLIADAFYNYFRAKGITEMSPELGLGLALGSYVVVRINKPTVKSRILSGVEWIKSKITRRI